MLSTVIGNTSPYWAAEYAITYRYFTAGPRTRESDLRWVRVQMVKEWAGGGVYGKDVSLLVLTRRLATALEHVENTGTVEDADELARLFHFTAEEFQHYATLCEAHALLTSEPAPSMSEMNALADGDRLKRVRDEVREQPRGELVVELSEGGGLALFFAMVDALEPVPDKTELDGRLQQFAQATLDDEKKHLHHRFASILDAGFSDEDWRRADAGLQRISEVKLRERNAQFGAVFSEAELEAKARDLAAGRRFVAEHLGFLDRLLEPTSP